MTSPADSPTAADDTALADVRTPLAPARSRWPFRRLALGFSPTPHSGLMLLLVGAALGPLGLRVLTEPMLATLEPAISVALVALGALVGLDLLARPAGEGRLLGVASLDAGVTILIVAAGMVLLHAWTPGGQAASWVLPLILGICAAPSSSPVVDWSDDRGHQLAARIADLDDVLPIVLSAPIMILWMGTGTPAGRAALLLQGALLAAAMAFAARVLISQTSSESEQRVFTIGGLLLLGGTAAYLSLSAPLIGLVAGVLWSVRGGAAHDRIVRDVRYLQHPLTVLLLVVAGARVVFNADVLIAVAAYVVLRTAGKLAGGWAVSRAARAVPRSMGLFLSAPGIVGVAIALDALYAHGDAAAPLFTIVITGALCGEVLALLLDPYPERTR